MQLQITTDYAIRIIGYLCEQHDKTDAPIRAKELAEELGITPQYSMKVIKHLKEADVIESTQGCNGGYRITEEGMDLTFKDIIQIMEGDICINRCLKPDGFCSRDGTGTCPVHRLLEGLQSQITSALDSKTIKEVWMGAKK